MVKKANCSPLGHLLAAALLLSLPFAASADWILDSSASEITFLTVKKRTVPELNHFRDLQGSVNTKGWASISIPLDKVDTKIPVRDERMRTLLFETAKFSEARITAQVDAEKLEALEPGETTLFDTRISLTLRDVKHEEDARLQVTALKGGRILVSTVKPVVINASDYQLLDGLEKLREIAGLDSISPIVPVTVKLLFEEK
ncbi:YceI family protein [Microbulbifer guangxiensis]|uniref:YceI family protein n=1 Tax=Microbulbifer guangxiensis TaxID=2904249 RepID=UPI001F43E639|nr:YceI family protein [Microbulbifer guangxiensis]